MTNIWEVLFHGLSVSLCAGVILLIKRVLSDKLSPRWQYSVWGILILRFLIPPRTDYFILHPIPLWLETLKGYAESFLSSAYTDVYEPISLKHVFPLISGIPSSITDHLFVIYLTGMITMLLKYLFTYISLRSLLKNGDEISVELREKIKTVSEKYSLKTCHAVLVEGIDSAFISGVIKPVLAIPAGKDTDEKVILHELMHLRYRDSLQSVLWSILRAMNWHNPFMHYIFDIIGNDMESLCDQMVLEVLEGEERREYGIILLQMANEKYARATGTSSISNGGKNIKRRIEAIVRFKKYPRGMAVVSVCMIFIMTFSLLGGYKATYALSDYNPGYENIHSAMALARQNRCGTVAGAIDMYAKGILNGNSVMMASVSPVSMHKEIERNIRMHSPHEKFYYDAGRELAFLNPSEGYRIFNLTQISDDEYEAVLLFHTNGLYKDGTDEMLASESGEIYGNCGVSLKIRIYYSDGWCVEEKGERRIETNFLNLYQPPFDLIDATQDISAKGEYGTVRIRNYVRYEIPNTIQNQSFMWNSTSFNMTPIADAVFSGADMHFYCEYDYTTKSTNDSPEKTFGMQVIPVDSVDEEPEWPDESMQSPVSGVSSDGFVWNVDRVREWDDEMDEIYKEYYGKAQTGSSGNVNFDEVTGEVDIHGIYKVRIFWDGVLMDEMTVSEETR